MPNYQDAFGLSDNPFCPTQALAGMHNLLAIQNLSSLPLRVHEEPLLMKLYCPIVGTQDAVDNFKDMISDNGYEPPSVGTQSFLTVIRGPQGTGKTTLANVLVHHLKKCGSTP